MAAHPKGQVQQVRHMNPTQDSKQPIAHVGKYRNESSPRPQTAIGPTWANWGNGGNLIKIDHFFFFLTRIELGASKYAKNTLLRSAKLFHYREFHSGNCHFFVIFGPKSTLGPLQPLSLKLRCRAPQLSPAFFLADKWAWA